MYTCYIQSFKILSSFCSWAGWFESYLFENPEDTFLHDVAQMIKTKQRSVVNFVLIYHQNRNVEKDIQGNKKHPDSNTL